MTAFLQAIRKYGYVAPAGSYKPLDFSSPTPHFGPDEDAFTPYVKAQLMHEYVANKALAEKSRPSGGARASWTRLKVGYANIATPSVSDCFAI